MTRPRKELISLSDTPYYHITARCVRRAFLCGVDDYTGKNYEHRRQWVVDRIRLLSSLFAIDICAYAVMSNHYHLVLKLCPAQLDALSDQDVINRWCSLFKGPLLIQKYRKGESLAGHEKAAIGDIVAVWRKRLADISWFMRCLNQNIARRANLEDECSGRFWECRFQSQALKTEEALISCMAYVDLNPVRAKMADTPEQSDYTSVKERVNPCFCLKSAIRNQLECGDIQAFEAELKPLLHFEEAIRNADQQGILFSYREYLTLLDWTGRVIHKDKRGRIDPQLPAILLRMQIDKDQWIQNTTQFETLHRSRFNRIEPTLNTR